MAIHPAINSMLKSYRSLTTPKDEQNALKEIIQKICLLGLHRENFFTRAAFYGGTALRMIYGLERFSEDLDFCLDQPNFDFRWAGYKQALESELELYGFDAQMDIKKDDSESAISSAFIKQSTLKGLLLIESKTKTSKYDLIKVRLELDKTNPPGATFENKMITQPEPFMIRTLDQPSLFAGKMHAIIARKYADRVKGRDYFDLLFYISRGTKINLTYLSNKLKDSAHLDPSAVLTEQKLREIYLTKISTVNFKQAASDVSPYLRSAQIDSLKSWNVEFFAAMSEHLRGN